MRADVFLFEKKFVESRQKAKNYIEKGVVFIDGRCVIKSSEQIDESLPHDIHITETDKYVGRGGLKLEAAIKKFGVDPRGKSCIDIGASTGGFTDCLLQYGASTVAAVDSGTGQLHQKLRSDPRVTSYEGINARYLSALDFGGKVFDIAVMDVSFISQTLIIPTLSCGILSSDSQFVTLIKPQFESGKQALGKGGIVKKTSDRLNAVLRVVKCANDCSFVFEELTVSPILGGDGNTEYLALFSFSPGKNPECFDILESRIKQIFADL